MPSRRRPQVQRTPSADRPIIEFFTVRATTLLSDVRAVAARLFGVGNPTDSDEEQEAIEDAEVLHPVGFLSRPKITGTIEAVVVRDGDEIHVLSFNRKDGAALTASDLDEGETVIHSDAEVTASITFRKTGGVEVRCKSGQDIKIFMDGQSATSPVAHEGSGTTGHTHGAGSYVAGPYPVTSISASATDTIDTGQGAQHIKVPTS